MSTGYHPLLMFDRLTGDMLNAELRSSNVYTSKDVVAFIKSFLESYDKNHPEIQLYVRGNSGFSVPAVNVYLSPIVDCFDVMLPAWKISTVLMLTLLMVCWMMLSISLRKMSIL